MKERLPLRQLNQVKEFAQGLVTIVQFALDPRTEQGWFQEPRTVVKREMLVGKAEKITKP